VTPLSIGSWLLPDEIPAPIRHPDGHLGPPVPRGRRVALPGRGEMFVREVPGPPGAPTLVLLHGWMASGGLNWFRVFEELGREFRVLAPDLRGHARGLRPRRFRLEDCADDVAVLCRQMGADRVLAAGYSMGGPVAQLLLQRHPDLVAGLVLCATSDTFSFGPSVAATVQRVLDVAATGARTVESLFELPVELARRVMMPRRPAGFVEWAGAELGRHSASLLTEAAFSVMNYAPGDWTPHVSVPTAVVVTTRDRMVPPDRQMRLADEIRRSTVHFVDAGHGACARERFVTPMYDACATVASRARA
jgi:pimeloyl-ACP methyl ester carboxylesterase